MNAIPFILNAISHIATTAFAICAFFVLRSVVKDFARQRSVLIRMFSLLSAMKIRSDFDQIEKMREVLHRCIQKEQYEETQHLQELIDSQMKAQEEQLQEFKEMFGDIAEIDIKTFGGK